MAQPIIGIYSITNTMNGKIYIGQSWNIMQRWRAHRSTGHNRHLNRVYKKHGFSIFEFKIIQKYSSEEATQEVLDKMEMFYINQYKSTDYKYGYNMREGGNSGKLSEDTKKLISIKSKNMWSKPEIRNKIIASFKQRPKYTDERIQKIKEASIGRAPTKKCIEMSAKAKRGIRKGPITSKQSQKISMSLKTYNLSKNTSVKKKRDKAKYAGVYKYGNRWKAWYSLGGKLNYIGCYDSEHDAYVARCKYIGGLNAVES